MKNNKSCSSIDEINLTNLTVLREKGVNMNAVKSFIGGLPDEIIFALYEGIVQADKPSKIDYIDQCTKGGESCMAEHNTVTVGQNFQLLTKDEDPEFKERLYRFLKSKGINAEEFSQHVLRMMWRNIEHA